MTPTILHVLREDIVGGQQAVVNCLIKDSRVRSAVFCRGGSYIRAAAGVCGATYFGVELPGRALRRARRDLIEAVRTCNPDVLHCHDAWGALVAVLARTNRPILWTWHTDLELSLTSWRRLLGPAYRMVERQIARRCWALVAVGENMQNRVTTVVKGVNTPVVTVPNGIGDPPGAIRALDSQGPARIGWIGRMIAQKRPRLALETMHAVVSTSGPESVRLTVAGDGPEMPSVTRLVESLDLSSCVSFSGEIRDSIRDEFYESTDLLLFTSTEWEAFGLVLIEAMRRGIPVVGTPHGELPYLAADGGALIGEGARELADRIIELIGDEQQYRVRSEIALHTSLRYAVDSMVDSYLSLYVAALGRRSHA